MSQQKFNRLLPCMTPGGIIEVNGDAIEPKVCSWFKAQVELVDQKVSSTKKTELVYVSKVKILSPVLQDLVGNQGTFNLDLCRPIQPSENIKLIPGKEVEVLIGEMWIGGLLVTVSVKKIFTVKDDYGQFHEVRKTHVRRKKVWSSNGKWVLK